jgi:hypothetical protein
LHSPPPSRILCKGSATRFSWVPHACATRSQMYDGVLVARDGPYAARPRSFLPACFQSVSTAGRPPRAPEVFVFLPARKEDVLARLEQVRNRVAKSPEVQGALVLLARSSGGPPLADMNPAYPPVTRPRRETHSLALHCAHTLRSYLGRQCSCGHSPAARKAVPTTPCFSHTD